MIQFLLLFTLLSQSADKFYNKTFYLNGNIASEGWTQDSKKIDYWFYYFDNGTKKCQGSYKENKKINWWIVYRTDGSVLKKCQYKNDVLNGLSIHYIQDKIICAEKYEKGIKKKIYYSIEEYKKDQK
jgi:antitoxin component YwqK of YwqJK toxin-antitoxin module